MDTVTQAIQAGDERKLVKDLTEFIDKNKTNFKLEENLRTRKVFCTIVLGLLKQGYQHSPQTLSLSLNALRIFARQHEGVEELTSKEGLRIVSQLAELTGHDADCQQEGLPPDRTEVVVEATKVLCNLVLNHRHLTPLIAEIGCLDGLSSRLALAHTTHLPHDLLFFNLRLLFLITACGPVERVNFREHCKGLQVLHNIIDATLFGPSAEVGVVTATPTEDTSHDEESQSKPRVQPVSGLAPLREGVWCAPTLITDEQCGVLCEALKIVFNQTLHWKDVGEYDEDEMSQWIHLCHLLRVLLISLPPQSKICTDTISHCAEVLVNAPEQCAKCFLLPPDVQVMPTLRRLHPDLYADRKEIASFTRNLDCVFDEWNMCAVLGLVNLLQLQVISERPHVAPVLTALRVLSKGHRSIRRFLKSLLLPPLKKVTQRPDEGDSLKSRVVRLMTAGSLGAEEVTAELLFVLCKEKVSRLVKHTGFGNAAGLLLSRGLLGGGRSSGEDQYSSDSESSDTEEYEKSRDMLDPVTGGLSQAEGASPFDGMTEEQKEKEAEELAGLFDKLESHGVIKVMPVDKDGRPMINKESESDTD